MLTFAILILAALASFYGLWLFYLAVMNLKRVRDLGLLSPLALAFGMPILFVGLALDLIVNVVVMTVILVELPQETTVTSRLKRHNRGKGWRKAVATWFEPLLDPFDPSGNHI